MYFLVEDLLVLGLLGHWELLWWLHGHVAGLGGWIQFWPLLTPYISVEMSFPLLTMAFVSFLTWGLALGWVGMD